LRQPPDRRAHVRKIPNSSKAQYNSDVFGGAVSRSIHQLGYDDSVTNRALVTAYRLSPAVDSVAVADRYFDVYPASARNSGQRSYRYPFIRWGGDRHMQRTRVTPDSMFLGELSHWARFLGDGALLRIVSAGSTVLVGGMNGVEIDHAIQSVQRGQPLSHADSTALLSIAPAAEWKAVAHPTSLERVGP
jgi:hypothetical protein